MTKQTIYQVLVALGAIFTFFGLTQLSGLANFLVDNLDSITAAVLTLVGVITAAIGFFKPKSAPQLNVADIPAKSVVTLVLVALGSVAAVLGLTKFSDIINYLSTNLDTLWASVATVVGILTGLFGYFQSQKENA